jgi:hypothetical protein
MKRIIVYCLLLFCHISVHAQEKLDFTIQSLKGLKKLVVVVDVYNLKLIGQPIDVWSEDYCEELSSRINKDISIKLNQLNIDTTRYEDAKSGIRIIVHRENTTWEGINYYNLSVDFKVRQWISLLRDPAIKIIVETWKPLGNHDIEEKQLNEELILMGKINNLMDQFTTAYLKANPKRE